MKNKLSPKNGLQKRLLQVFFLAALAFGLVIGKLLLLPASTPAGLYILEFLALLLFLAIVYLADMNYRMADKQLTKSKEQYQSERKDWNSEKELLKERIAAYEALQNDAQRFASYREKILKELFEGSRSKTDRHHFLFLLAETFKAGAAVLYRESEPEGTFIVEESYALPEDFEVAPFSKGEGLNGQAVADAQVKVVSGLDEEMLPISSGLGQTNGRWLYLLPVCKDGHCTHLIEMVCFQEVEVEKMWNEIASRLVSQAIL
ncbi:MAG TPA: hypothetical protein GXZ39_12535 [Bacteroidales bacterium]|jgi:hypothetical protein|nr:hypothetical protein [Bacteroidales bacterium]